MILVKTLMDKNSCRFVVYKITAQYVCQSNTNESLNATFVSLSGRGVG